MTREPTCRCCGEKVTLNQLGVGKGKRMVHWECYKRGHGDHCKHPVNNVEVF